MTTKAVRVMKRLLLGGLLLGGVAVLSGCPIFPDNSTYRNGCSNECCSDSDCGYGFYCSGYGQCVEPQDDASSGTGSLCGYCPANTVCTLRNGLPQCAVPGGGDDAGYYGWDASVSEDGGQEDAIAPTADGGPDAGDGGTPRVACNGDSACGVSGSKCIDGYCAPRSQLCSDATQCKGTGEACVDGVCLPTCSSSQAAPCPTGYQCDFSRGVCSINNVDCGANGFCQGGTVCVESRCVAPVSDGGACPAGLIAINGGCIPDESAAFACTNIGNQGALASTCEANSVCLHGDCYASCNTDGGTCAAGESCKPVTTQVGGALNVYYVCAAANTMGSECDPALGLNCPNELESCINGYCK
jgi:hypothetical protein